MLSKTSLAIVLQSELTSSTDHVTIDRSLPNMDLRIEIIMLELVYAGNFTIFGHSERELRCFENFIFRNYIRLTGILICVSFVGHPYCGSAAQAMGFPLNKNVFIFQTAVIQSCSDCPNVAKFSIWTNLSIKIQILG